MHDFGDSKKLTSLYLDADEHGDGYIESTTLKHKTATTKEELTTFLPFVAPSRGLTSVFWGLQWLKAREEAGLDLENGQVTLPAQDSCDQWMSRSVTTGKATGFLRDILASRGVPEARLLMLSSHALKATLLSWAA